MQAQSCQAAGRSALGSPAGQGPRRALAGAPSVPINRERDPSLNRARPMRITLLESNRRLLQTAECAALSIMAHGALIAAAATATNSSPELPQTAEEARVFFLLPPDRAPLPRSSQPDVIQWAQLGGDFDNGLKVEIAGEGRSWRQAAAGKRGTSRAKGGARPQLPWGPPMVRLDSVFSVLEVDSMVERHSGSAAPAYPPALLRQGTEGVVYTQFVVDTAGRVDTTSVRVLTSPHPLFSASVMQALGQMRFRPAVRAGHRVRQLVEQHFRFAIVPQIRQMT